MAALVLALPALAQENPGAGAGPPVQPGPPEQASQGAGGPPAEHPQPPEHPQPSPPEQAPAHGVRDGDAPPAAEPAAPEAAEHGKPETARQPDPHASAAAQPGPSSAPPDSAPAAESAPGRVKTRSVGQPDFSGPPTAPATPDTPAGGDGAPVTTQTAPAAVQRRGASAPQLRGGGPIAPSFGEFLKAAGNAAAGREAPASAKRPSGAPVAAAPVATAQPAPAASEPQTDSADAPDQPLPVRIVPRTLRRIVEVVPAELWAALGALALLALVLAASSWVTARRARRLQRQRQALLQEVGVLQAALLPVVPAEVPASVAYRPGQGSGTGGDFYDAFALADGSTGVILGEASADGRDSLALTTFIRYTLRAYLEAGLTPREVVKVGAEALADHLESGYATVTVGVHDPASGRFTYASAGQAPPVVTGPEAHPGVTACSAPPLGIGAATGFRQSAFTLTPGSLVCLYTRGVVEARADGRLLGVETLREAAEALPADAGAEELLARIAAEAEEAPDDMAVCLLRAPADAPHTGVRIEEFEVDEREVGDSLEAFLRACGVPLAEVPGILREAGEAARREGSATVRVRLNDFRPGVDVVPGNVVRLEQRRQAVRL